MRIWKEGKKGSNTGHDMLCAKNVRQTAAAAGEPGQQQQQAEKGSPLCRLRRRGGASLRRKRGMETEKRKGHTRGTKSEQTKNWRLCAWLHPDRGSAEYGSYQAEKTLTVTPFQGPDSTGGEKARYLHDRECPVGVIKQRAK